MNTQSTLIIFLLCFFPITILAQNQLSHNKQVYKTKDGKLYVNRSLPTYFYISASPDEDAKQYRIESKEHEEYSNPLYWGLEGKNKFKSPSCVDTVTKRVLMPNQPIYWEVYADSEAPVTKSTFKDAQKSIRNSKNYFGEGLKVELKTSDKLSGTEAIYFSVNGSEYAKYDSELSFEGINTSEYVLKFYSVDHVGNVEKEKEKKFLVDITPPRVRYVLHGVQKGENVLSTDSYIELKATDNLSGVKDMYYSIDGEPYKLFNGKIALQKMAGGHHTLNYYGIDKVGNSGRAKRSKQLDGTVMDYMNFIVDNSGPEIELYLEGDNHKGKYHYISGRTYVDIKSSDKESGTAFIFYGVDKHVRADTFEQKFTLETKPGLRKITYGGMDNVKNIAKTQSKLVFVDVKAPITSIDFKGAMFFNRDTLFISKKTKIQLISRDAGSGVKLIEYAVNDDGFQEYNGKFSLSEPGFHQIKFRSSDNVNNAEQEKTSEVVVDDTPPEIYANFSIKPIGVQSRAGKEYNVYPPYTRIYLGATDLYSGTENIFYSTNGSKSQKYTASQNFADKNLLTKEGFYKVKVSAVDKLGNESSETIKFFIKQ